MLNKISSKGQSVPSVVKATDAIANEKILALWLHGKSPETQASYRRVAERLMTYCNHKPIQWLKLEDLQGFIDEELSHFKESSQRTYIAGLKSLFSFVAKLGIVNFNIALVIKSPQAKNELSHRILDKPTVIRMIQEEPDSRNQLVLKIFYYTGIRASELAGLQWKDLNHGVLTVFGKGGKTRYIRIPEPLSRELESLRPQPDNYVIPGRSGKRISREHLTRIVNAAAKRIGVKASAHWLRHAHASHSLKAGASIALVSQTLGHSDVAITSKYLHCDPSESSGLYL